MSKIKEHYWDKIIEDNLGADASEYDLQRALHYQSTIWNIVALIQQYGMQQVFMDICSNLERREVK